MILKIIDEVLLRSNSQKSLNTFYEVIKDISKRRSLSVLHLKKTNKGWNIALLECAIPNVIFKGLVIPDELIVGASSESIYIQLNYKVIKMLENGSTFIINNQNIVIKNGSLVIKDAYPYTQEEIEANYSAYRNVIESSQLVNSIKLDQSSSLLKYLKVISNKTDAFFYTKANEATILVDESMVMYSTDDILTENFYFNCYLANRILNFLSMTDYVELKVFENNLQIEGFIDGVSVLVNTSPIYEMPMDVISKEDIDPLLPKDNPVEVDTNEFVQSILNLKSSANGFISNTDRFKFVKNGKGLTLQFKEIFNGTVDETEVNLNIGQVDEESGVNQLDYFIYLPIKCIQEFAPVGSILSLSYDENDCDTSVLVKLSDNTFIITGKN